MSQSKPRKRPPIHLIDTEADSLMNLAIGIEDQLPDVSELLIDEIARARICTAKTIPSDVVTMMSTVVFEDEANGKTRQVQLVFPKDADIASGRISILTPIGAGLIGVREGTSIFWPDREQHFRALTVKEVVQAAPVD